MQEHFTTTTYLKSKSSIVTIGTFDGVHQGHQAILKKLVNIAQKDNLNAVLLTFFPHPRMVLQKDTSIKLINTIEERKILLQQIGIHNIVVQNFTKEFSRTTALEFVRDLLVDKLQAKKIIIGYDHRFGRNRNATIEDLREFGKTFNFEIIEINEQQVQNVAVSSTKIRTALSQGDIKTANTYLGYNFIISGTIVKGKSIGKTISFPTANLHVEEEYKLIPKNGVYIVQAKISEKIFFGITNIGFNPTLGGTQKTIETHFLDFNENLYNKKIQLQFISRIRDEKTFDSLNALKEAIQKDEMFARQFLANNT